MGTKKATKWIGAVVAAWAIVISVPAAPAHAAAKDGDRVSVMKRDSGWDIP